MKSRLCNIVVVSFPLSKQNGTYEYMKIFEVLFCCCCCWCRHSWDARPLCGADVAWLCCNRRLCVYFLVHEVTGAVGGCGVQQKTKKQTFARSFGTFPPPSPFLVWFEFFVLSYSESMPPRLHCYLFLLRPNLHCFGRFNSRPRTTVLVIGHKKKCIRISDFALF